MENIIKDQNKDRDREWTFYYIMLTNDLENSQDYQVIKGECFYKGEYTGIIRVEYKFDGPVIYYIPIIPVTHITVEISIDPEVFK